MHYIPNNIENLYPKVAIVGKPNVGKSTLFNRICKKRLAIIADTPGVTRDRKFYQAHIDSLKFIAIDTAGWSGVSAKTSIEIEKLMMLQTKKALAESDVILFIIVFSNFFLFSNFRFQW